MGVVDARATPTELHRQAAGGQEMLMPVNRMYTLVEFFGVAQWEARHHQQHTVGQTRPQTQPVRGFHAGLATHRCHLLAGLFQAEPTRLFQQQALKAFRASQVQLKLLRHHRHPVPQGPKASPQARRNTTTRAQHPWSEFSTGMAMYGTAGSSPWVAGKSAAHKARAWPSNRKGAWAYRPIHTYMTCL